MIDSASLKAFVEANPKLVKARPTSIPGTFVLKYSRAVFYDGLWNEFLEECRGLIVDSDYNIVSYPFTKIYNYGIEKQAPVFAPDTKVDAFRKVNGYMVAMTWHDEKLLVSTTGSTDSDYVAMAEDLMQKERYRFEEHCEHYKDLTWMFEAVHRNDPHIIPEKEGLYLLGARKKAWGSEIVHNVNMLRSFEGSLPVVPVEQFFQVTVAEVQQMAKECKHEGFVFYADDGRAAKIKSPYYLTQKFMARNPRTDKLMRPDIKNSLDEEYYPLIDAIQADIAAYTSLSEQDRLAWIRQFLEK